MLERLTGAIDSRRGGWVVAVLAGVLSLPALRLGFQADDHILRWYVAHHQTPWQLFSASDPMLRWGRDNGAIAWWSNPQIHVDFFRPLASLLHSLEMTLWPEAAWAMLAVNIVSYMGCAAAALHVYRRLLPRGEAALAALLFTIDDAHAHSVGWIAGRNTVLALMWSLVALSCHLVARQERKRGYALLSTAFTALALASAEAGTWAVGLLVAYALTIEPGGLRRRARSIAPQLGVAVIWATTYLLGGYGLHGSSFYHSLHEPLPVALNGILNLPLSITSLLGPSLISFSIVADPWVSRAVACVPAALLLWLVIPRIAWTPTTRFFVLAAALCLVPTFLTVPQDRVLIGSGVGAFGLIASVLSRLTGLTARAEAWCRRVLQASHLVLAPLLFPMLLGAQHGFEVGTQKLIALARPGADVIIVNTPVELITNYAFATLDREGDSAREPRTIHQLYAGGSPLSVTRIDATTLDITAAHGWGALAVERIFCSPQRIPKLGERRHAHHLQAQVMAAMPTGMPKTVRFTFPTPLESPERQWLVWRGTDPVAWTPPSVGETTSLTALNLLTSLPP